MADARLVAPPRPAIARCSQHRRVLGISIGAGLIGLGLLETTLREPDDEPTHRRLSPLMKIGVGVAVIAITWADIGLNAVTLNAVLLLALALLAAYGGYVWFHAPVPGALPPLAPGRPTVPSDDKGA